MSEEAETKWDGYTNFEQVSGRVAREIQDGITAAAFLQEYHKSGGDFGPTRIVDASSRMVSAALLVDEQLDHFGSDNDEMQEILDKWRGDNGRIEDLRRTDFLREQPDWLVDFARELQRAGLVLGYLKSGREEDQRTDGDADDSEVRQVIEEMTV